jgi:hypothetical protein
MERVERASGNRSFSVLHSVTADSWVFEGVDLPDGFILQNGDIDVWDSALIAGKTLTSSWCLKRT